MTGSPGSGFGTAMAFGAAACGMPDGNLTLTIDPMAAACCAPMPDFGPIMTIENGVARCGAGCTALPCSHWPDYRDFAQQPRMSDADVDRIARRVVDLLDARTRVAER